MIEWIQAPDEAIEESRAVNAMIEELVTGAPQVWEIGAPAARQSRIDGGGWMGKIVHVDRATSREIDTEIGPITVRTIVPDQVDAVYLHLHGGGWVLGAADQQDVLLDRIASNANVAVMSVDYRLAPEHPYPAGPDDCEAAAVWLIEHASEEFGTERLIIGGESAGAHLAALTLLRLRDRFGTVDPFVAANLVFGAFDVAQTPSSRNWGDRTLVLSSPIMEWFGESFTPGMSDDDKRDPAVSPLYADLSGMVPALFVVGDLDPLIDDSLFMGGRWRAAGNEAEVVIYPESIHGFVAFPTAIGNMATERQLSFLARHAAGR